ncbi:MAG: undecaprenyldiphospho-muramoylpentapeptide beta-N-acetylglucosaminyltransferase [Rikenellaceae bacterium]|jgi:UDP-N-acetylglucosamine--N-acetylmuramyl-(pentapeptide) pyrophosphoryl-undecaprenol N-acetylglucosamine transferase|nr:undecaprenyldiphospho-muramoylpentapeptide beta-N-acetylglucosaminyltransferase [Rikenellaceae bacterium]
MKIILSGGGTGGHIYPAVSVAEALKRKYGEQVEILFVGAEGKMEMERIPALGYPIIGLPVAGLQRKLSLKNLALPFKVIKSLSRARKIVRDFRPDVVVGFGGYASAPVLRAAQSLGVPTVIQEQNSYAGVTNKLLARRARRICVAYDGMERFFPADRIVKTGNPLRGTFGDVSAKRAEALDYFGLQAGKPVILLVGGSLGTRTLNEAVMRHLDEIVSRGSVQLIWQTGKYYAAGLDERLKNRELSGVWRGAFIERMDYAFAAADVVVSRAGASTVSELCLVGLPTIFVPSPNVAEDHQTKNAQALSSVGAALLIPDAEAVERVIPAAIALSSDRPRREAMRKHILALGIPDSADRVVREIEKVLEK